MPTIVEDLRAIAASPGSKTKAEVALLAAADRIEATRMEMARMKHDSLGEKRAS